ncbi:hypothetical protein GCM10022255_069660 [Dactylosporangium darangshiense]|uniref:Uncharacterized protein n=1 Tax=Dactylosporangium darangshiense TaxID=579108 RepID=A0ABP8DIJ2_9ACTN
MTTIELVRVLQGHTDPDSAYLVNDYPYGYTLRCQIRYWVETAAKGAKRGMQRFVSQTTNPKQPATVWNKPKPATYDLLTVMYLDGDDHVQHTGVGELGANPQGDAWFRLHGIYAQLTDEQRHRYDGLVALSRRYAQPWEDFEASVTALAAHLADTGAEPEFTKGTWTDTNGRPRYIGAEYAPVYLALARRRNTGA